METKYLNSLRGTIFLLFIVTLFFINVQVVHADAPTGCVESSSVLNCTGLITTTSFDTINSSIWIHDAIITATTASD